MSRPSVGSVGRGRASLELFEHHVGAFFEQQLIVFVQQQQADDAFDPIPAEGVDRSHQLPFFDLRGKPNHHQSLVENPPSDATLRLIAGSGKRRHAAAPVVCTDARTPFEARKRPFIGCH